MRFAETALGEADFEVGLFIAASSMPSNAPIATDESSHPIETPAAGADGTIVELGKRACLPRQNAPSAT